MPPLSRRCRIEGMTDFVVIPSTPPSRKEDFPKRTRPKP
jgi:hypothetical protein